MSIEPVWIEPQETSLDEELRTFIGGHSLVVKTLQRRGYRSVEQAAAFLNPSLYRPSPPSNIPNLVQAVERVEAAILQGESICVWGDFDVDGQTSTALLMTVLSDLGATAMSHIPLRESESHGVHLPALRSLIKSGVDLFITCDTGIGAHQAIAYAQDHGVDVIVTDHHDLPLQLPDAHSVVNPKTLPENHPLRELPGVGVAFKLAEALYDRADRFEEVEKTLDLVALGIVADVAMLSGDVRYLLQCGLKTLRGTTRLGLKILLDLAKVQPAWLTEEHIRFVLAPRLNAIGRLSDAKSAVELLTTNDLGRARILANEMEGLNARRKLLSDQVMQAALEKINTDSSLLDGSVLVLAHPTWPTGVIGIVAGRLTERFHRPTVLIHAPQDEIARGSARSIEGVDISAAIAAQGEILRGYGGHPMAAGFSIDSERLPDFRKALSTTVEEMMEDVEIRRVLQIDGYIPFAELTLSLVEDLERLAPFGPGNPGLTLATNNVTLGRATEIGRSSEHLLLVVEDEVGTSRNVVWWRGAGWPIPEGPFDLAYTVRTSDYRGEREVQIEWQDARPAWDETISIGQDPPSVQVIDCRLAEDSVGSLKRLRAVNDIQVWCEADEGKQIGGRGRYDLVPSMALAIWTIPPGSEELWEAMNKASPSIVYLFAHDPGLQKLDSFLPRLAGMVKYSLRSEKGRIRIPGLATALAHREETIRKGIAWLEARGDVTILDEDGVEIHIAKGSERVEGEAQLASEIGKLLEETASFRTYFHEADIESLKDLLK